MLFNSIEFIVFFLPVSLIVFHLLANRGKIKFSIFWLFAASLFFYGWWNPYYLILICSSILCNYGVGLFLTRASVPPNQRLFFFVVGVMLNLGALFYFKYANFFVSNLNIVLGNNWHIERIILPLAISFFTFQQIAFISDAYKGRAENYNFFDYCLFVTFFPQLIAGPIVHHKEMFPQFRNLQTYSFNSSNLYFGLSVFSLGLFKKVVLADGLSVYVTPVFSAADQGVVIHFFEAWAAALSYTFQLYFDFSGYSDMAIGIARMFNINLPQNFDSPYQAVNIIQFWRRWHMTLSRFLKDYLYIPLGGNRRGNVNRHFSLMVTMLLGGLWHGASWTFVCWGGLHGIYLSINHGWRTIRTGMGNDINVSTITGRWAGHTLTFFSVVMAWVLFRAESFSCAINIYKGMIGKNGFVLPDQIASLIPGIKQYIQTVGTMPLLGGGSVMGVFEMIGMLGISFILIAGPTVHDLPGKLRFAALTASLYFTIQAVFFGRVPSEFLYFQF